HRSESTRPRNSIHAARPRRRGHRISGCLAAIAHSRLWHFCDIARLRMDSAFGGRAVVQRTSLQAQSRAIDTEPDLDALLTYRRVGPRGLLRPPPIVRNLTSRGRARPGGPLTEMKTACGRLRKHPIFATSHDFPPASLCGEEDGLARSFVGGRF